VHDLRITRSGCAPATTSGFTHTPGSEVDGPAHRLAVLTIAAGLSCAEASKVNGDWVDPGSGQITFAEWAPTWLATKASRKAKTGVSYASALRNHVLPRWSSMKLTDITHADVVRWQAELAIQLGPSLRRLSLLVLSQALTLAVRDGRLARNSQRVTYPTLSKLVLFVTSNRHSIHSSRTASLILNTSCRASCTI
jgi:hypothetical protein